MTPIPGLNIVLVVAKPLHKLMEHTSSMLQRLTLRRPRREAKPRQGRNYTMESLFRLRVRCGENINDLAEFVERAGPSMYQQNRLRILHCGFRMHEMHILAVDRGQKVRPLVHGLLLLIPIVLVQPVLVDIPCPLGADSIIFAGTWDNFLIWDACVFELADQSLDFGLWDVHFERSYFFRHLWKNCFVANRSIVVIMIFLKSGPSSWRWMMPPHGEVL